MNNFQPLTLCVLSHSQGARFLVSAAGTTLSKLDEERQRLELIYAVRSCDTSDVFEMA